MLWKKITMFRLLVLLSVLCLSLADLPIDCRYPEVVGTWTITETERTGDASIDCSTMGAVAYTKTFTLAYPNVVTDELGFKGTWTMMINQGFEVNINERSYFASFHYSTSPTSYDCSKLYTGWARDDTVRHWSCFTGVKATPPHMKSSVRQFTVPDSPDLDDMYVNDHDFIRSLNEAQSSWTAKAYPEHELYTRREMKKRAGNTHTPMPPTAPASEELKARVALLPENFDWRDVEGQNYVSPVRDQQSCGSCYSFAALGMAEARVRIETGNTRQDVFSPQDVVSCSTLSEGCDGGFNYLIGGRYGKDVGFASEECNVYTAMDGPCTTTADCPRTYVSEYEYVGGYYGACNEEEMMEAIVTRGPLPVSYMVYNDFFNYVDGIYHHVQSVKSDFDPFYPCSHAVLAVGYGVEPTTGEKYWIVKNSWGRFWGDQGYFMIRRGTNECGMESGAFDATVIS